MNGPVAILFDRFGPYHLARLRAAAAIMPIQALELCGESTEYAWDAVQDQAVPRVTLFPERDRSALHGNEVRRAVRLALDRAAPAAVAVPGWATAGALAALEWCALRRCPAIIMSESTATDERRSAVKEWIKRRLVRLGSAALVGGQPHRAYVRRLGLGDDRIFTGYDAVDNAYFACGAAEARQDRDALRTRLQLPARYFLASSRFIEKKNLPMLLRAYAAYRRQAGAGAWSLVLLGDGVLRGSLEQQRVALGIEDAVLLPGFKQYGDLSVYYGLAAAFVHASTSEPWGLVVNEAMACGLPVLVSHRCGCSADLVIDGRNGWTFDPNDEAGLVAALVRMSGQSESARASLGAASSEIVAHWSPERFAAGLQAAVSAAFSNPLPPFRAFDRWLLRVLVARQ